MSATRNSKHDKVKHGKNSTIRFLTTEGESMDAYNTVEEALDALRNGQMIIVTDDETRENEGDLICAAEFATTETINFMATHAKGLICSPISADYAEKLQLSQMLADNTDNHGTAFTISIDHVDTTTGISAIDRGLTIRKIVEEGTTYHDFRRPGHVFPLLANKNGVLGRNGHTEATVDLMRLAGLKAAGVCVEIMADDGEMMRTAELMEKAKDWGLKMITIKALQDYRKVITGGGALGALAGYGERGGFAGGCALGA